MVLVKLTNFIIARFLKGAGGSRTTSRRRELHPQPKLHNPFSTGWS